MELSNGQLHAWPLYPQERTAVPTEQEVVWTPQLVQVFWKKGKISCPYHDSISIKSSPQSSHHTYTTLAQSIKMKCSAHPVSLSSISKLSSQTQQVSQVVSSLKLSDWNGVYTCLSPQCTLHTLHISFYYSNMWWRLQIMKLFLKSFLHPPAMSCLLSY